jgi:cell division protein FtsI/penicillin-binding protein 2
LAELSSAADLVASLDDLGLFTPPPVPLEVIAGSLPALDDQNLLRSDEAAGQGQLTLSPLQMAWAMAAIANDGDLPSLRLVRRIGSSGIVIAQDAEVLGVTTETANRVKAMMLEGMDSGTAAQAGIDGVDVAAHVGMAIAGPAGEVNSWFLGIAPANIPKPFARYVVVLLMEGATDPTITALAGRQVLESLLDGR